MIKAVIIDFDDTLCLTEEVCFRMENEILAKMGRPAASRELHIKTWGIVFEEAMAIRSPGIDFEEFKKYYRPTMTHYVESGYIDAVSTENIKALDDLIAMGIKIIILTSRAEIEVTHLFESDHILSSRVHEFYHKDNIKYHKPDPRAFDEFFTNNDILPEECIYIGDSVGDAAASTGAGIKFIASLESGIRQKEDFKDYQVEFFMEKFTEIVEIVQNLK